MANPVAEVAGPAPAVEVAAAEVPEERPAKRIKAAYLWEYCVLRVEDAKKEELTAADVHFLKSMDASTWIPAGQKSSHNLCLLKQGAVATAWFHFDCGHRYKFSIQHAHEDGFVLLRNPSGTHAPMVAKVPKTYVFTCIGEKPEECRFARSLDITVTKMSGEEVYGRRLQNAMPCWRFKQIVGQELENASRLEKEQLRLVSQSGKLMPGGNSTLKSWLMAAPFVALKTPVALPAGMGGA